VPLMRTSSHPSSFFFFSPSTCHLESNPLVLLEISHSHVYRPLPSCEPRLRAMNSCIRGLKHNLHAHVETTSNKFKIRAYEHHENDTCIGYRRCSAPCPFSSSRSSIYQTFLEFRLIQFSSSQEPFATKEKYGVDRNPYLRNSLAVPCA
jgi:hypothetical protein